MVLEETPSREKPDPSPSKPKTKYYGVSLSDRQGRWLRHVPQSEPAYPSPSKAGGVVIKAGGGNSQPNGWTFWIETSSGKTLAELRDEYIRRRR